MICRFQHVFSASLVSALAKEHFMTLAEPQKMHLITPSLKLNENLQAWCDHLKFLTTRQ